jgi:protein-ribulosamine 3-kinase
VADWREAARAAVALPTDATVTELGVGPWSTTWSIGAGDARVFAKTAVLRHAALLDAEIDGLAALGASSAIRTPAVLAHGRASSVAWVVLEWLPLSPPRNAGAALGRALAALHRLPAPAASAGRYGWHVDNFIGATAQPNGWCDRWIDFWRDRRLRPQLAHAAANGHDGGLQRSGERLVAALPALLRDHQPVPSLVHGDLWSGNAGSVGDEGVVFDPSVHVGDREVDVAMTELFGGFGREFQAAYRDAFPLDARYPLRRDLYNVYHLLNHLNLFGDTWLVRCEQAIGRLLAHA